jgi:acyl carrier protein
MMREVRASDVSAFIVKHLAASPSGKGVVVGHLPDDCDLLLSGLVDSLGLLELTSALSEFCGQELDFDRLSPDDMTVLGALCRFVAEHANGVVNAAE